MTKNYVLRTITLFFLLLALSCCSLHGCSNGGGGGNNGQAEAPGDGENPPPIDDDDVPIEGEPVFRVLAPHGSDFIQEEELEKSGKKMVTAEITSATADEAGRVTISFKVYEDQTPVTDIESIYADIAQLRPVPQDHVENFSKWVPYFFKIEEVETSINQEGDIYPNPVGYKSEQADRKDSDSAIFTNNGNGTYKLTFDVKISGLSTPLNGVPVVYDRTLTHRVSIMMGGASGPTASAYFDFVPDGSPVTETRNIVETTTCRECHGAEFHGHGGDSTTLETCNTCHVPMTFDAQSGNSLDMKQMIHKIHAGSDMATIPGPDGSVFDDPSTAWNESADNGEYAIFGDDNIRHSWEKHHFPATLNNCTKCHKGNGKNVDNWKKRPSRDACGSCHNDIDWPTGINHWGGYQDNDILCNGCHPADGPSAGTIRPISTAHDYNNTMEFDINQDHDEDIALVPEFTVQTDVSTPANGVYFKAGESPVISVVLTGIDGSNIDHTSLSDPAYLFVNGPRAKRNPVLTTAARAGIDSINSGPWNFDNLTGLKLVVDNGYDLHTTPVYRSGITVKVSSGNFTQGAATPQEVVTWLKADETFNARALAEVNPDGTLHIRSRNLGLFFSLEIITSDVAEVLFSHDDINAIKYIGGVFPANRLDDGSDPKAALETEKIFYNLDPVNDLSPGTYSVLVMVQDKDKFRASSIGKTTFQVKTSIHEPPVAENCGSCHSGSLAMFHKPGYNAVFDATTTDQCGSCHDNQSGSPTGDFYGAKPLSRLIHGIHRGSDLLFPNETVWYPDYITGRNWEIDFPQDIRNCEACHKKGLTTRTWQTNADRFPCRGCHDSEQRQYHFFKLTKDPTPANPYSGDEKGYCPSCHW